MKKAVLIVGTLAALVFAALAGAAAQSVFRIGIGDHAVVKGSRVACGVSRNATTATAITCFEHRGGKTVVGSYAMQLGDKYAALLRVTSTKGGTKPVVIKRQR